jgi:hypothetical protein
MAMRNGKGSTLWYTPNNYKDLLQKAVTNVFSSLSIVLADDLLLGVANPKPLRYYGTWGAAGKPDAGACARLLKNRDGGCGEWAFFFRDVLTVQGVTSTTKRVVAKTGGDDSWLFVKGWMWKPGVAMRINVPFKFFTDDLKAYSQDLLKMVDQKTPLPSQGGGTNPPPMLALFNNHILVELTTWQFAGGAAPTVSLYDPSYGKLYGPKPQTPGGRNANLLAFQNAALDYVAQAFPDNMGKLAGWQVAQITAKTRALLLIYDRRW